MALDMEYLHRVLPRTTSSMWGMSKYFQVCRGTQCLEVYNGLAVSENSVYFGEPILWELSETLPLHPSVTGRDFFYE